MSRASETKSQFSSVFFRSQIERALNQVRNVLHVTRHPSFPKDCQHTYTDKYGLAEIVANASLAGQLNALQALGLSTEQVATLADWSQTRSVTLRLQAEERCEFIKEASRKVESKTEHVTTTKVAGLSATRSDKVVTRIDEWFWKYSYTYSVFFYPGNMPDERLIICGNEGAIEVVTTSNSPPYPQVSSPKPVEVNVTWLFNTITANQESAVIHFVIDRDDPACRTPRRNPAIDKLYKGFAKLSTWTREVAAYLNSSVFAVQSRVGKQVIGRFSAEQIFVPVVPLFEEGTRTDTDTRPTSGLVQFDGQGHSVCLSATDINHFLDEQRRTIAETFVDVDKVFDDETKLISIGEGRLQVICQHIGAIATRFAGCLDFIEVMMWEQLVAAIGKEVSTVDFEEYMQFHNRTLFKPEFQMRPFSQAIRRPEHSPEGVLSIEAVNTSTKDTGEPIYTTVRAVEPAQPMNFAISASTRVTFNGQRFLHSWIDQSFNGETASSLVLTARARQFSSFILLVGRIASASVFEPTGAILIQNKDDLRLPLICERIPTPKEFRDAIESLSPEQQAFAKAYRAMQLESTLFGVVVIQIKPQLEKLLRIPNDSLAKEIRLTQDLLELFIKYQIPADLLSFDGDAEANVATKVDTVRSYVTAMQLMIQEKKEDEITEAAEVLVSNLAEQGYLQANTLSVEADCFSYQPEKQVLRKRSVMSSRSSSSSAPRPSAALSCAAPAPPPPPPGGGAPLRGAAPPPPPPSAPSASAPPPPPPSPAAPAQPTSSQPTPAPEQQAKLPGAAETGEVAEGFDFTAVPRKLDSRFDELDLDAALRPTILKPDYTRWTRKFQKSLLSSEQTDTPDVRTEKNKAFDLLDALSRSGSLAIDAAELHVLIASTHCFAKSLMDTVVSDNVNPIEKVERSILIVAQTIQDQPVEALLRPDQLERVRQFSPNLF